MLKRGLELPKLIMNEALDEEAAAVLVVGGEERVRWRRVGEGRRRRRRRKREAKHSCSSSFSSCSQ